MKKILIVLFLITGATKAQTLIPDSAKFYADSGLVTVCGKTYGTHQTKSGNIFVNMGAVYPLSTLTLVIFPKDTINFKSYQPISYLKSKDICVSGKVKIYKDKPEIIVKSETQIRFPKE